TWPVESFLSHYVVLAYADDMILASSPSVPASTVREDAHAALARVGLSVTIEKCASTQDGGISFMGTRIIRDSPYNLAECATRSLYESLRTLRAADVSRHDKIRLLAYCIVPSVNYGPLVDAYPGPQSYQEVDALVVAELGMLLGIPDKLARALALTPRTAHGVGLVLPHHYHADMQRQARAMQAGTFRELRKAQLADTAPLHTFLPLALLRGPPLSDDQVLFIGDCLAGRYQKTPPMGVCRHCKQPMLRRHHLVCKAINALHVARHTKVMEALLTATRGKTSRIVKNVALPIGHLQPDFVVDDGFGDLVVTVPWRVDRSYSLKLTKYLPLLQQGRAAFFLPIVVGGDGTLHPATASGLARIGVDLLRFRQGVAQILLWHYAQTAQAFASLSLSDPPRLAAAQAVAPGDQGVPTTHEAPHAPRPPSPSPSPSVEIVAEERPHTPRRVEEGAAGRGTHAKCLHPRAWRAPAPAPPAPLPPEDPSEPFVCSRAPSPPPLGDEGHAAHRPGAPGAEPQLKALPPIFRRVDGPAAPPSKDSFYPFKKLMSCHGPA
ncbi:Reverse transcriptase/endonuclease, partial [Giardia duodenalis]